MNDLEKRIEEWKGRLRRNPSFEKSDIIEMESHLRSLIDQFEAQGFGEKEAFEKAAGRFGEPDKVGEDVFKVRTTKTIPRPSWKESSWVPLLLRNYLKTLGRNISRHKFYTSLNLVGLTIGITCCLMILLFIQNELSYDRHHENSDRIYRVTVEFLDTGTHWAPIAPPVAQGLKSEIPEIVQTTRLYPISGSFMVFGKENDSFRVTDGVYADSTVFDVFTYPLLYGDPSTALTAPRSVVLSSELARTLFGNENPVGRTLEVVDWEDDYLTVTGVLEPMPETTHFPLNYMVSMSTFYDNAGWNPDQSLTWAGFYTYALLEPTADQTEVERKLPDFVNSFYASAAQPGQSPTDMASMYLQPITDIHLHSSLEKEYRANSDITYVYLFGIVAAFVLLIACANFINLTTARAADRMREIGIRKTLGAGRRQLAFQFLSESVVLSLVALILAYGLTMLMLPTLNQITGKTFTMAVLFTPRIVCSFVGISLLAGLLSGSYPAIYMSGFSPVRVLKGVTPDSSSNALLRKGLVIFQFAISMFLIIGTVVVYSQLNYLQTRQMGFDKEGVINVPLYGEFEDYVWENKESLKQELMRNPGILSVSIGGDYPGQRYSMESIRPEESEEEGAVDIRIAYNGTDHDFITAMGIDLVSGRNFSRRAPADTAAWLINEAAVQKLGLEEPVGHLLHWDDYSGPVVGVIENFNYASLHTEIEALVIPLLADRGDMMFVRAQAGNVAGVLDILEQKVSEVAPSSTFEYSFLSNEFNELYRSEQQMSRLFWYFSLVAILIACLGLFGLSTYTINQRAKEIGVRKAMGASVQSILVLVSWKFVRLIGIAFLLAAPVGYIVMNHWLSTFAYQTGIGVWIFAGAGAVVLALALVTIGYQAFRSAVANPVKSLRSE